MGQGADHGHRMAHGFPRVTQQGGTSSPMVPGFCTKQVPTFPAQAWICHAGHQASATLELTAAIGTTSKRLVPYSHSGAPSVLSARRGLGKLWASVPITLASCPVASGLLPAAFSDELFLKDLSSLQLRSASLPLTDI